MLTTLIRHRCIAVLITLFILLTGCAKSVHFDGATMQAGNPTNPNLTTEQQQSIDGLAKALVGLGTASQPVNPAEAKRVAHDAHVYTMVLANEYNLMSPPLYHNYLVNKGDRRRGLCFHWTHDLVNYFRQQNLQTLDLHWAVGYQNNPLLEHNSLVITAVNQSYDTGLLIDPWRESADLLWMPVSEDEKYPWKLVESYTKPAGTRYLIDTYKRTI